MPLQNRVDPFGQVHAVQQRGLFTGNRGVIHDPDARALLKRRWTTRAWIACDLVHPQGKRRDVLGRNGPNGGAGWTELFFLDEVTALAAGHRPCFYCRREAAKRFAECFAMGSGLVAPKAAEMDARLHGERFASGAPPVPIDRRELPELPDGTMVCRGKESFAVRGGFALPWSFAGYGAPREVAAWTASDLWLLTPPSTVAALRAGYRPAWHPSAGA